jgi:hypothetical protein
MFHLQRVRDSIGRSSAVTAAAVAFLWLMAGCGDDAQAPQPDEEDAVSISTSHRNWYPASLPVDPDNHQQKKNAIDRLEFIWYNIEPTYGAHRRDFNPHVSPQHNTSVPTLDIELDAAAPQDPEAWVGIMTGFRGGGLDLADRRYIEIWVNDFKPNPQDRGGRIYIDVGIIDEDFYEPGEGQWQDEDQEKNGYELCFDDTGFDGEFNAEPECVTKNNLDRDDEGGGERGRRR